MSTEGFLSDSRIENSVTTQPPGVTLRGLSHWISLCGQQTSDSTALSRSELLTKVTCSQSVWSPEFGASAQAPITSYRVCIRQVSCVLRAYRCRPSVICICCSSTLARRVALLFPHHPQSYYLPYVSHSPYFPFISQLPIYF